MLWALEVLKICSFFALIMCFVFQLPPAQLENALTRTGALKAPLIAHASQPNIRSSLPRFIRKFHFLLASCYFAQKVFVFFNKLRQGEVGEKCHLTPDLLWMYVFQICLGGSGNCTRFTDFKSGTNNGSCPRFSEFKPAANKRSSDWTYKQLR